MYSRAKGSKCFNEEELVELIAPIIGSRRVARNIVRHLVRQNLLRRVKPLYYCIVDAEEVFRKIVVLYVSNRLSKQNIEHSIAPDYRIVVSSKEYCEKLSKLVDIGLVVCSHEQL